MFDAGCDRADERAFAERCKDDRHHFRFIVSPEDAGEMTDLRAFTRDLAQQMESRSRHAARLGGRRSLEHRQPSCPSSRTRRRRCRRRSRDLAATTSAGACARAPRIWCRSSSARKPEHEIRNALEKEVTAERWTRLDVEIRASMPTTTGSIDLRPETPRSRRSRDPPPDDRPPPASGEDGPRYLGRSRGVDGGRLKPSAIFATSACAATSSRPCTAPSPSAGQDRGVADYVIDGGAGVADHRHGWSTRASMMS